MVNTPRNTRARSVSQQAGPSASPIQEPTQKQTNPRRSMPVVELPSSRSSAKQSTPKATSTPPKSRQRSTTATPTAHHHKSADEIAIEEAEELLENVDVEHGDARSRRHEHLRLSRLRSLSQPPGPEIELGEEVLSGEEVKEEKGAVAESVGSGDQVDQDEVDDATLAGGGSVITDNTAEDEQVPEVRPLKLRLIKANALQTVPPAPSSAAGDESDDDSSEVDSDDDTSATSDSDSDSDSDADSDDDDAELERLLQAAKVSATNSATRANEDNALGGDGDVVSFETDEEKQARREA
jgi:hypothetical protein